ncbi:MAG: isoaspartyl peptidase/L-asparaginase family protein [Solirubrobacteraceae bacterium]
MAQPAIAVHGGAGGRPPDDDRPYREALEQALEAGGQALRSGGCAVTAVQAATELLEDCPLFNAGRGSVLHRDGAVEMDAGIMCGRERRAGAVAVVTRVRHPIALAVAVMERSDHVLVAGVGAERLAEEWDLRLEDPEWFVTERQRRRWEATTGGTVGAVALDSAGHVAAATSTGGMRGRLPGRVGDSPLVGAGVYAEDGVCAVSATGDGEQLIRAVAAHEVAALIRHRGLPVDEAAAAVLDERVRPLGGQGGLIALSGSGKLAMPFTTGLMYRGWLTGDGPACTRVGHEPEG